MTLYKFKDYEPQFEDKDTNWIAADASLIGQIVVGRDVNIWFGAVLRGDNEPITLGAGTNVQEHTVMHTDMGFPLVIGEGCTIGHRAMLHGCTIGENSLIGIGSILLNGSRIGKNSLVGAGALVTEGKEFPDNSLIVGSPARVIRQLGEEEVARLQRSAAGYVAKAAAFKASLQEI